MMTTYSLMYLADYLGATIDGDADYIIYGLASLVSATENDLALYMGRRYSEQLTDSHAGCILVSAGDAKVYQGNKLIVDNPYLSYAKVSMLFADKKASGSTIHKSAVIANNASIGENVSVGANAVVEENCHIQDNSCIGAGAYLGRGVMIGKNTVVNANVTIYHEVIIGDNCIFHSGCVIGADGFGFAPSKDGWQKIYQLGSVKIGNDVEIGANTTIDRGALDDTLIDDDVKIDNQVQIGHNTHLGAGTAIASKAAIAGSVTIGKRCTIAGLAGIAGHLSISDDVHITGMTLVSKSIPRPGSYSSGTKMTTTSVWRKNAVRFNQLDKLIRQLKSTK